MVIPTPITMPSPGDSGNAMKKDNADSFAIHVKEEEEEEERVVVESKGKGKEKKGGNGDGDEKSPAGRRTPRSPVECR